VPEALGDTSPLLYLHRIQALNWLPRLFSGVWVPSAVLRELQQGRQRGYDVPDLGDYGWLRVAEPCFVPSEWLALDLGTGELAVLALALESPDRVVLLDDGLARRIAHASGLTVWGTLRVLIEAKSQGMVQRVEPLIDRLEASGMWISREIRRRVLLLAGEAAAGEAE
jgi:predicted nucleic acid-binding protein